MTKPFEDLYDTIINGNISAAKKILKSCSRQTRYEFVEWLETYDYGPHSTYRTVIKWCILGDLK